MALGSLYTASACLVSQEENLCTRGKMAEPLFRGIEVENTKHILLHADG